VLALNEDIYVRWLDGRVWLEDSVETPRPVTGKELRERYAADLPALTAGLARLTENTVRVGPIDLVRFGRPKVLRNRVDWPIESGAAAGGPGGTFSIKSAAGRLEARVESYKPTLPIAVYMFTQLPIHHLFMRLHLLRVRGRDPLPGVPADPHRRRRAAVIDGVACVALTLLFARRKRLKALAGVSLGYHVACWSLSGRTLGGLIENQRVVAVDGSRPSAAQALVRFLALPWSWIQKRPVHDEVACTEVVAG